MKKLLSGLVIVLLNFHRSSGTTGSPKGIVHSYSCLLKNLVAQDKLFDWPRMEEQKYFFTSNLFHSAAFYFVMLHGLR